MENINQQHPVTTNEPPQEPNLVSSNETQNPSTRNVLNQHGFVPVILGVIIVVLIIGLGAYYLGSRNSQTSTKNLTNTNQVTQTNPSNSVPQVINDQNSTLKNKIVFISPKYVLNIADSNGQNVQPFNQEVTKNFKSIGGESVSPDHAKLKFVPFTNPPKQEDSNFVYIASFADQSLQKIDLVQLKGKFGDQYSVSALGWSSDSKKLVLLARDVKNFLDNRCCEGGDYRSSKQIFAEYDLTSGEVNQIFTKTASPLGFIFYNPTKKVFAYTDSQLGGGTGHLVNLSNNSEVQFDAPNVINYQGTGEYFVNSDNQVNGTYQEARILKLYSIYDPTKPIAQINLDEPAGKYYTNWLVWSPNNQYFAIYVLNSDNRYPSGSPNLGKIYDRAGKLVLNITQPLGDYIFSGDEKSILFSNQNQWTTVDIKTGSQLLNPVTSPDLGKPIYWF